MNLKKQAANILTLTNFSLGVIAIMISSTGVKFFSFNPNSPFDPIFVLAASCILLASVLDRFDGKIARKTHTVTELGKQLDSLSDLVSFGVAPAIVFWQLQAQLSKGCFVLALLFVTSLIFPICGAIRLAKFNIQEDPSFFIGIPITIAGALAALSMIVLTIYPKHLDSNWVTVAHGIFMLVLAYLMVSKFKLKKV